MPISLRGNFVLISSNCNCICVNLDYEVPFFSLSLSLSIGRICMSAFGFSLRGKHRPLNRNDYVFSALNYSRPLMATCSIRCESMSIWLYWIGSDDLLKLLVKWVYWSAIIAWDRNWFDKHNLTVVNQEIWFHLIEVWEIVKWSHLSS